MKKEIYLTILFDYYEEFFTEKQKDYFKKYYFDNLSLGEISILYNVSRNAVFKQIKIVEDKLEIYEDKLKCYYKDNSIRDILLLDNIDEIKNNLKELINN